MSNESAITPFKPENMEQGMKLAEWMSKSTLIPRSLQNKPSDVLIVMMKGMELGLQPMQALAGIHVIEGKAVVGSELIAAQCLKHPKVCEFFRLVKSDALAATYEAKRVGAEKVTLSYTIEQAQRAGLTGKDNWKRHTETMLRWRCTSALARAVFPDLVMGMVDQDEADEIQERV